MLMNVLLILFYEGLNRLCVTVFEEFKKGIGALQLIALPLFPKAGVNILLFNPVKATEIGDWNQIPPEVR